MPRGPSGRCIPLGGPRWLYVQLSPVAFCCDLPRPDRLCCVRLWVMLGRHSFRQDMLCSAMFGYRPRLAELGNATIGYGASSYRSCCVKLGQVKLRAPLSHGLCRPALVCYAPLGYWFRSARIRWSGLGSDWHGLGPLS